MLWEHIRCLRKLTEETFQVKGEIAVCVLGPGGLDGWSGGDQGETMGAGRQEAPAGPCQAPEPAGCPELWLHGVFLFEWAAVFALAGAGAGGWGWGAAASWLLPGGSGWNVLGSMRIKGQGRSLAWPPRTEAATPQPLGPAGPGRLPLVWAPQDPPDSQEPEVPKSS